MSWSLKRGKLTSHDRNYLGAFCKIPTFAGKRFFHSLPPSLHFFTRSHFLRGKIIKISFFGLSLLWKPTETLATQASRPERSPKFARGFTEQAQIKLALIGQWLQYLPITPLVSGSSCEEPGILIGWQTIPLSSYCYAQSVTLINVTPLLHEFANFSPSHDSIKLPPRSRASWLGCSLAITSPVVMTRRVCLQYL